MRVQEIEKTVGKHAGEGKGLPLELDHLWLAVPFLLVIWISSTVPLPALDFWWHLKAGQIILESGAIPGTDIFSYTAAGKTYVLQNWLAEVLFYLVYRVGGPALVIFFNTLLLLATVTPIYYLCLRAAESRRMAALAACLAAIPLAFQGNIRPQVFSFLMFAWFYFVLVEYQKRRRNLLWLLPLLMVLWVNLHGGFVLGLILLLLFVTFGIEAIISRRTTRFTHSELLKLIGASVITAGVTLLNPQFIGIYEYVRTVASDPVSLRYVLEWQPPQVSSIADVLRFFGPFFLGIFILTRSRTKPDIGDIAVFLGLAIFAFTARRNAAWFALVAAPILAPHICLGKQILLRPVPAKINRRLNLAFAGLLGFATIVGLPWFEGLRNSEDRAFWLLDSRLPVRAADFILNKRVEGRIFHPQHYGDYLIWRLWPHQRTFFDGRVHLFTMEVADDYFAIQRGGPGWEETAAKYRIQHLLLDRNDEDEKDLLTAARASRGWRAVYEDSRSILFTRQFEAQSDHVTQ